MVISEAAAATAGLAAEGAERQQLQLKGVAQPVPVRRLWMGGGA